MTVQFRPEVYRKRKNSLWGKVLLKPDDFYNQCTKAIVITTFVFFLLLFFGHYTTKETVQGFIEPRQGLISVYAPNSGTVEALYVQQGSLVQRNDPLLKLDFHETLSDGQRYDDRLSQEIGEDKNRLQQQLQHLESDLMVRKEELEHQTTQAKSQLSSLEKQWPLEQKNNETLRKQYDRLKIAYDKGSIAQVQFEQIERELAVSDKNMIRFAHEIETLTLQITQFPLLLKQIENQHIERKIQLEQQISQVTKTLLDLDRRTRSIVVSPIEGVVTQMDLKIGQTVRPSDHLVDLKKTDDLYWAKIYVSSHAIGFIKPGQEVSIRVHSYPHQHYGSLNGTVEVITDSIYQGSGNTTGRTFYIVYVSLPQQSMSLNGKFPLKQGMQIDADIKTQEMTFMQKIFEPLLRFKD